MKTKSSKNTIRKIARFAVVSYVWLERNVYVFCSNVKYEEAISNATAVVVAVKVIGRSKIQFHLAI